MRYCEMCEAYTTKKECKACGADTVPVRTKGLKLTRQEQLQELADRGCDTWEEYRGER
jgi:hypothetical protein